MSQESCYDTIKNIYSPLKKLETVDWKSISKQNLENNSFSHGVPFFLSLPPSFCYEFSQTPIVHAYCHCRDINGNRIPGCTSITSAPILGMICVNVNTGDWNLNQGRQCFSLGEDWYQLSGFCCCSNYTTDQLIATPEGVKNVANLLVDEDLIDTAKIQKKADGFKLVWEPSPITFSQGASVDFHQSKMIKITFETPLKSEQTKSSIIVTPDHLFLLPNGKLKRADQLIPSQHLLVDKNTEPIKIYEVEQKDHIASVHHVATGRLFNGKLDNHLILLKGVVTGDFILQISPNKIEDHLADDHQSAPKIGTIQYEALLKN